MRKLSRDYLGSEKDALAIRFADTRKGRNREPMVSSRQALARHRSGVSQEAIAKELGVSAGNVSQMISAAEAEEELCGVADLLVDQSKVSRGCRSSIEELTRIETAATDRMLAMARDDKSSHARTTALPLDNAHAEIEWLVPPPEDALARLLLELIGEDALKEIFHE